MIKHLKVISEINEQGKVTPLQIIWEDGRLFNVDIVLEIKKLASTKGGGAGTRFTVKILNRTKHLYLREYFWWIEIDENKK